jgi:hypothetical protein
MGLVTRAHLTRVVERAMLLDRPPVAVPTAAAPHERPLELPSGVGNALRPTGRSYPPRNVEDE